MTERQEHNFDVGQRVKLVRDALYPMATFGSEGWVRKRDHDNMGYPMIYIEWDKDHWAYNGEGDEWTMAAHFESMKDKMASQPDNNDKLTKLLREILEGQQHEQAEIPQDKREFGIRDIMERINWPDRETYKDLLTKASTHAADDEAFLLLTIRREGGDLVPILTNCYLTAESAILLEAQLSRIGALAHSDAASQLIEMIFAEKDKDEDEK